MPCFEVSVRGRLSESVLDLIRSRFGEVLVVPAADSLLVLRPLDAAAQRALLTLLWDLGHEVLALNTQGESP
jgi:hypothetical protein